MTADAFPLCWPVTRKRTEGWRRKKAKFVTSFAVARDGILKAIRLAGGKGTVISTNVTLRRDGLPLAGQRNPDDPGVAVYYTGRGGRPMCVACDLWNKVEDNMTAVMKTIDAIRGIERWGGQEAADVAFSGFVALPPPPKARAWWEVFGFQAGSRSFVQVAEVEAAYRREKMNAHPDRGGSNEPTHEVERAWQQFRKERGLA